MIRANQERQLLLFGGNEPVRPAKHEKKPTQELVTHPSDPKQFHLFTACTDKRIEIFREQVKEALNDVDLLHGDKSLGDQEKLITLRNEALRLGLVNVLAEELQKSLLDGLASDHNKLAALVKYFQQAREVTRAKYEPQEFAQGSILLLQSRSAESLASALDPNSKGSLTQSDINKHPSNYGLAQKEISFRKGTVSFDGIYENNNRAAGQKRGHWHALQYVEDLDKNLNHILMHKSSLISRYLVTAQQAIKKLKQQFELEHPPAPTTQPAQSIKQPTRTPTKSNWKAMATGELPDWQQRALERADRD